MSRVLIVIDKYGWSYDTIARGLIAHNRDPDLRLALVSAAEDADLIEREHERYDLVFALGWTSVIAKRKGRGEAFADLLGFIDRRRLITGIHSHRSWDGYESTPGHSPKPPPELIEKLGCLRGVNVISRRLHRIFVDAGLERLTLTENGVDTTLFAPSRPPSSRRDAPLVVGFSGSTAIERHDTLKGFSEFIQPLADLPNVTVRALGGRGAHQVAREAMPALYDTIDLYVCASSSEGFSQSVLEASACGRAVVSTRVGGCEDLIRDGVNGYLVERDGDALRSVVTRLEADRPMLAALGARNREIVCSTYAWHNRVADWLAFIRAHLPRPAQRARCTGAAGAAGAAGVSS